MTISNETVVAEVPQLSEIEDYEQRMAEDRSSGISLAAQLRSCLKEPQYYNEWSFII